MADLQHLFGSVSAPEPKPASPRKSLRYRLSRRANGLKLLQARGREHFAAIGRLGGVKSGEARRARTTPRMVPVSFYLGPDEFAEVQALSQETGQSQAALLRGWIEAGLAAQLHGEGSG